MYVHSHSPLSRGFQVPHIKVPGGRGGFEGGWAKPITRRHDKPNHPRTTLQNQTQAHGHSNRPLHFAWWRGFRRSCLCSLAAGNPKLHYGSRYVQLGPKLPYPTLRSRSQSRAASRALVARGCDRSGSASQLAKEQQHAAAHSAGRHKRKL